tara:strand:- start:233 stop:421 length:189 start_codon:yes stop_codon:yes gene_type:complete
MRTLLHKEMMMDEEEFEPQEYIPLTDDEIMMLGYYFEYATAWTRQSTSLTGKPDADNIKRLN